ncbi:hypothetical protein D3C87_1278110 [compost metagenome]
MRRGHEIRIGEIYHFPAFAVVGRRRAFNIDLAATDENEPGCGRGLYIFNVEFVQLQLRADVLADRAAKISREAGHFSIRQLIGKRRFGLTITDADFRGLGNLPKRIAFAGGLHRSCGDKACEEKAKY